MGRHLAQLNRKLIDVAAGRTKRLIVAMPPRHGKSEFISKYFTAWFAGNYPDDPILFASYEAEFAASWGGKTRDILEEYGEEVFGIKIKDDTHAKNKWAITGHLGGMQTAGIGGAFTGKGAKLLIIDDPFKNGEQAASKTQRDKVFDWFQSAAYTRLEPDGAIIIIMTRWNEDDLPGRLLKEAEAGGEQWEVLSMPAIAEKNDSLGRKEGEALFPERYDEKRLNVIKRAVGSYYWSALYQQRPQPEGGTIFKRSFFRYFREETHTSDDEKGNPQSITYYALMNPDTGEEKLIPKEKCWKFQTCDAAATEGEHSDYFVLATWIVTPDKDLLLDDVFREKAETVKHRAIVTSLYQKHRPKFVGVESKTFGLNIIQDVKRTGIPLKPLKADVDKVSRARPMSARYEIGTVYHRQGAPWLNDFEDELVFFNKGEHDDQVDNASYAGIVIAGNPVRVLDTIA